MKIFSIVMTDMISSPFSDKVILPEQYLNELLNEQDVTFSTEKPVILKLESLNSKGDKLSECICGVREFSLDNADSIWVPYMVYLNLKSPELDNGDVFIRAQVVNNQVPDGTEISLEPLGEIEWINFMSSPEKYTEDETVVDIFDTSFIYNDTFVKSFLESRFNNTFTVLSLKTNILFVSKAETGGVASSIFKFKIHDLKPKDVVCIVNVDLNLEIVHNVKIPVDKNNKQIGVAEPFYNEMKIKENEQQQKICDIYSDQEVTFNNLSQLYRFQSNDPHFLKITCNNLDESMQIVVGSDELVDKDCFMFSTIGVPSSTVLNGICSGSEIELPSRDEPYFIKPIYLHESAFKFPKNYSFCMRSSKGNIVDDKLTTSNLADHQLCSHCQSYISKDVFMIHELRCEKNAFSCKECNKKFEAMPRIHLQNNHWHCNDLHHISLGDIEILSNSCSGESAISHQIHLNWLHNTEQGWKCDWCNNKISNTELELSLHKEVECPEHFKVCKFCHLSLPRGFVNFETKYFGLQGKHEFECGSKTSECYKCQAKVRQFEMDQHMNYHKMQLKEQYLSSSLKVCKNMNCCNVIENEKFSNKYQMCDICYSKFYTTDADPDGKKFKLKLERKYIIQLTKGCGYSYCKNPTCKSSGLAPVFDGMKELFIFVQTTLLGSDFENNVFSLCVDDSTTKRKISADIYIDSLNLKAYTKEWVYKAAGIVKIEKLQNIDDWLNENSVSENEL